jgi:trk system potassium uptake protein TrkH
MLDPRPVLYVIGLVLSALGVTMSFPLVMDAIHANGHWPVFFRSGLVTTLFGALVALARTDDGGS